MLSGVSLICFTAGYALVLLLEIVSLRTRFGWHRPVLMALVVASFAANTIYLVVQSPGESLWASPADWCLLSAWVLAAVYVAAAFFLPQTAVGPFILPLVLGLIAASRWASSEPFAPERVHHFWGNVHGVVLLLGTITVCIGFLAGLMYLLQSYRLKLKRPPADGFRLPSLEWLERTNSRALGFSTALMAVGFATGLGLANLKHRGEAGYIPWSDPVVLSLAAMLGWLVVAEIFRWVYPAARRGRKVAYLTLASFMFLVITLVSVTLLLDTVHGATNREIGSVSRNSGATHRFVFPSSS
jgi:ABC-type uncharacterized transport system permease subunit